MHIIIILFHSIIIALIFLNYFALSFGSQSRLRKEALDKMEEVMAKEHELLSLGGQAQLQPIHLELLYQQ
jgi:hypothetical protein